MLTRRRTETGEEEEAYRRRRRTTASSDKEEEQDKQGGGGYLFDAEDENLWQRGRKYMTYDRMESNGSNSLRGDLRINIH